MFDQLVTKHFIWIQVGIAVFFLFIFFRKQLRDDSRSNFRIREADRGLKFDRGSQARSTGNDRIEKPLQLTGARSDGAPHEILGISALATEDEIQKAYKELMKRYHPDRIGRQGSREWHDAQSIAEALNRARSEMLTRLKRRP